MSTIRSVHMGTKSVPGQENSPVDAFLRSESPPPPVIETVEVPIFPRSSWPGFTDGSSTSSTKVPRSMSDLRYLAPTVQIEEEDLNMEHMRVVDGWSKRGFPRLQSGPTYRDFSGLPPGLIAIADPPLRAGRHVESGGRIVPSISPCGIEGRCVYLGTGILQNG